MILLRRVLPALARRLALLGMLTALAQLPPAVAADAANPVPIPDLNRTAPQVSQTSTNAVTAAAPGTNTTHVVLIVGAPGEAEFGSNFVHQAELWRKVAQSGGARVTPIGLDGSPASTNDLADLHHLLENEPTDGPAELWLVLVGHGTFDGKEARFNLRGPDLVASEFATWMKPFHRPVAVINTASASAPFLNKLSASNRVVIAATRSGYEQNFTRFGRFLADSLADPAGDLDQDGQTSLLEAFLSASFRVAEFYKTDGRMATEHALIDDTGDGLGTPAEWFRGLRAVKKSKDTAALDGARAHQFHLVRSADEAKLSPEKRDRRDAIEREIAALRDKRTTLGDDAYFAKLEPLLLEIARLYREP